MGKTLPTHAPSQATWSTMAKVKSNGLELEYEVFNPGGGEPLVLIMGVGAQMVQWPDEFCQGLAARGFEVIRFDNRDIGCSTWLDHMGTPDIRKNLVRAYAGLKIDAPYTLTDMAADTAGLIEALGHRRAHVTGASMGGMIAQTLAIHHPERVHSLVSFMSTTGSKRHSLPKPFALKALLGPMPPDRQGRIERVVDLFRTIGGSGFEYDPQLVRNISTRAYDRGFHPTGFIRQFSAIIASGSRLEQLKRIKCPTTVIHGTEDPLVPPVGGAATARAIPNARLQWIEGLGHSMPRGAWPIIQEAIVSNIQRTRS